MLVRKANGVLEIPQSRKHDWIGIDEENGASKLAA
jgi:hypothetical protein